MCGIAGCFGIKDTKTVNRMLDALPHRGPNDRGIHSFNNTVFGGFWQAFSLKNQDLQKIVNSYLPTCWNFH